MFLASAACHSRRYEILAEQGYAGNFPKASAYFQGLECCASGIITGVPVGRIGHTSRGVTY